MSKNNVYSTATTKCLEEIFLAVRKTSVLCTLFIKDKTKLMVHRAPSYYLYYKETTYESAFISSFFIIQILKFGVINVRCYKCYYYF